MVELALVLPVFLLLVAVAFTGWDAIHQTIGLTSAARAGVIEAASDLQNAKPTPQALSDATAAINAEEGAANTYKCQTNPAFGSCTTSACANNCVTLGTSTGSQTGAAGLTVDLVTVAISRSLSSDLPIVSGVKLVSSATARYK